MEVYVHFNKITLNIQSDFSTDNMSRVYQRPTRAEMEELPSVTKLCDAIGKLRNGKAADESGILPEMMKAAWRYVLNRLLELVLGVWRRAEVPCDWRNAILVPIPKKGDFTSCDN